MNTSEKKNMMKSCAAPNTIYAVGVLGALVYFLQHSTSFTMGVVGVFKAIFWPGVILYRVLELLHM